MGSLRIIAGALKGRRIRVLDASSDLRPTPDRAREALFDILGPDLAGSRVLDAFAGTGALGFEAMSRGAGEVVFVESNRRSAEAIRATAVRLGLENRARVLVARAETALVGGNAGGPFDLVLADPPYADAKVRESFVRSLSAARRALSPGARVAVEREFRVGPIQEVPGLRLVRTVRYGRTAFDFYTLEEY